MSHFGIYRNNPTFLYKTLINAIHPFKFPKFVFRLFFVFFFVFEKKKPTETLRLTTTPFTLHSDLSLSAPNLTQNQN
jgi:hypothetical protein